MEFFINSEQDTVKLGRLIGEKLKAGDIICLNGEMGCGKTYFTKGIAKGLNIAETITSPTFTIVNEYTGRLKLYHFDVYRVNDIDEIEAIGFDEYIFSDAVSVIEWSDYIKELIPNNHLNVDIKKLPEKGDNYRSFNIYTENGDFEYINNITLI